VRILFLSHYYPPDVNEPATRGHEHARIWAKAGHDVTVITGVPNHPRGEVFPGYRNRWRQEEWIDGVRVVRTWMYVTANEGFFKRTANYVLFALAALWLSGPAHRLSAGAISDRVVQTSGGTTKTIRRLENRRLVARIPDPDDGRRTLVQLTDEGLAAAQATFSLVLDAFDLDIGDLDAAERSELGARLAHLSSELADRLRAR